MQTYPRTKKTKTSNEVQGNFRFYFHPLLVRFSVGAGRVSGPQTQDSSPPETRARPGSEQQRSCPRWYGHALRSPIHRHPARSEANSTGFTNQSLKLLLTFYAFVLDRSTGWTNLHCPSLNFEVFQETWRPTCTATLAPECHTNAKM